MNNNNKYLFGALVVAIVLGAVVLIPSLVNLGSSGVGQTASVAQAGAHAIAWNPSQFPSSSVQITLIRQTGTDPVTYSVVRNLAASAANNGSSQWTPAQGELDGTTFIQIGCVAPTQACQATVTPAS